jgi:hypothetical protein
MRSFVACILYQAIKLRSWAGHVAHMVDMKNAYKILVRKPEGKRPLRRAMGRWEDNIRMDLRKVG